MITPNTVRPGECVFRSIAVATMTNIAAMSESPALYVKAAHYLNPSFFLTRTAVYFAIWSLLAITLNWLSLEQDRTADPRTGRRMRIISGPGLVLFILTVTFASIDWVMSLDPSWSSTIFGFLFVAAWTMSDARDGAVP